MIRLLAAFVATWFHWTADGGALSFTDDPGRVPARYSAEAIEPGALACYARLTPTGPRTLALARACTAADEALTLVR